MGQATCTWVGVGCYHMINGQIAWRLLCALQAVPTIALAGGTLVMLESPRWLIAHAQYDTALNTLRKLHGKGHSYEEDEHIAQTSLHSIRAQVELDARQKTTFLGMLRHRPSMRRLLTGFGTMAVNQCTGQTVVWSYRESTEPFRVPRVHSRLNDRSEVNLLQGLGVLNDGPLLVLAGFMTLGAICNGGGGFVLDKLGRRKTYLIGLVSVWHVR